MNQFIYFCANCGYDSSDDFWYCPKCHSKDIIEAIVNNSGKIAEDYKY